MTQNKMVQSGNGRHQGERNICQEIKKQNDGEER
jgi:hypothetical protein